MVTSAFFYHVMHFLNITIDIRNVCVFLAPLFSSLTTMVTYHLTKELKVGGACRSRDCHMTVRGQATIYIIL